jgi:hypothetical protein
VETFPLFAAVVLVAHVTDTHDALTEWGARLYFWGRVAYVLLYAAGVPLIRSLVRAISPILKARRLSYSLPAQTPSALRLRLMMCQLVRRGGADSASRPGTPPRSDVPPPAREPGWPQHGMRGRPCPAATPARSADDAA